MSKALERRDKFRQALIEAAERSITAGGLGGLKTRELAREIGVANGAVYNLVADVDELILLVGSRTLARLDAALSEAERNGPAAPAEMLVRIAVAYCDFAAENLQLWRALFEHRMAPSKEIPEWAISEQMDLFRHIYRPLAALFPKRSPEQLSVTARSLFSAVHGMVALGLEQKLIAVPIEALRSEIATIVRAMIEGLAKTA
jgi:AcrR family transcriptional regulator